MYKPKGRRASNSNISTADVLALQQEFIGLDRDGNGEISVEELEVLLRSMRIKLRLSETEIRKALKIVDTNQDGKIDLVELNNIIEQYDTDGVIYRALSQRLEIRTEFQKYDSDKSGFITKDELVQIVKDRTGVMVSEKHLEGMLKDCDANDDNQIDYEEFCTMMTKSFMRKRVVGVSTRVSTCKKLQTIND
jgi:calcium-dependent protein kinase